MRLAVLGFLVMGVVSGWFWPILLIQSLSWWRTHGSAKMDASERILGRGRTRGVSFRPFLNSSVGGGLLVLYSLSGSPVIKLLMQMVTMVPGQGGRFQSVCLP